jgi:L-2-hydroxyglutarate oxidase LhgO
MVERVDGVVIGAGVVGLAVARALALKGREVLVMEAAHAIGTGVSSRNSEVIHAGMYYPTGSLKARWCVAGHAMLYDYCQTHGVAHRRCGKLVVANSPAQVAQLQTLLAQAHQNGVQGVTLLRRDEALALEPQLQCQAALWSCNTGIVDSHALMLALQGDLENASGIVVLNSPLERARYASGALELIASDGTRLQAKVVVNAAGLHAPALARCFAGLDPQYIPTAYYAKGNYFTLACPSPFSHLIYPVPEADGLGVHLTLDMGGQARFGPDVQWVQTPDDLAVDATRAPAFEAKIRQYWPELPAGSLHLGYAGVRPKISGPGEAWRDFLVQGPKEHGVPGLVNLFGIESPGLTSCLAIGDGVTLMLSDDA